MKYSDGQFNSKELNARTTYFNKTYPNKENLKSGLTEWDHLEGQNAYALLKTSYFDGLVVGLDAKSHNLITSNRASKLKELKEKNGGIFYSLDSRKTYKSRIELQQKVDLEFLDELANLEATKSSNSKGRKSYYEEIDYKKLKIAYEKGYEQYFIGNRSPISFI